MDAHIPASAAGMRAPPIDLARRDAEAMAAIPLEAKGAAVAIVTPPRRARSAPLVEPPGAVHPIPLPALPLAIVYRTAIPLAAPIYWPVEDWIIPIGVRAAPFVTVAAAAVVAPDGRHPDGDADIYPRRRRHGDGCHPRDGEGHHA